MISCILQVEYEYIPKEKAKYDKPRANSFDKNLSSSRLSRISISDGTNSPSNKQQRKKHRIFAPSDENLFKIMANILQIRLEKL
jgi:hypothetical protein